MPWAAPTPWGGAADSGCLRTHLLHLDYGVPPDSKAVRALFLCTNLPFFGCGIALCVTGHPYLGLATAVMGFISGGFHFYQCVDGLDSNRVKGWLLVDMLSAAMLCVLNVATASHGYVDNLSGV